MASCLLGLGMMLLDANVGKLFPCKEVPGQGEQRCLCTWQKYGKQEGPYVAEAGTLARHRGDAEGAHVRLKLCPPALL